MPASLDIATRAPPGTNLRLRAAPTLAWEALEYHFQPKSAGWYVGFGIVLGLLLFAAFLLRSFLTGVVFALAGLLVLLYSEREPKRASYRITADAIHVNARRYPFGDLAAFNLVESPTCPRHGEADSGNLLLVRNRQLFPPHLHLPIGSQDPEAVRAVLSGKLPEDPELRESGADLLFHWLGF